MDNFQDLLAGYKHFRSHVYKKHSDLYSSLAEFGQKPKIMVIACVDSRVDPTTIFSAQPGELFVLRNVANLVPPFESQFDCKSIAAAIQIGVEIIGIEMILILGHTSCGGVATFIDNSNNQSSKNNFINQWTSLLKDANNELGIDKNNISKEAHCSALEKQSIKQSIKNLNTYPFIKKKVKSGSLKVAGGYFDISKGELMTLNDKSDLFEVANLDF